VALIRNRRNDLVLTTVRNAALALILAAASASAQPAAAPLTTQDVDAIRAMLTSDFTSAAMAHNFDALAAIVTDDARLMPAGAPTVAGRAAIRGYLERNWGPLPIAQFEQTVDEVDGRGGLAFARGSMKLAVQIEGGPRIYNEGKFLMVLEKQANGSWLIAICMYSSDLEKPEVRG
jgi:ketosteroid isomerase-like protein